MKDRTSETEVIIESAEESAVARLDTTLTTIDRVIPLLGTIANAFAGGDFSTAIGVSLDALCETLGADDAEIFFSEPEGADLLLTACWGPDSQTLVEQTRFAPGCGFPGRVIEESQPLISQNLAEDTRYLRQSVVQCGINAYACVPMRAPYGLRGSLNVAWRRTPDYMDDQVRALEQVASLLSTYISAQLSQLRYLVDQAMESTVDRPIKERLDVLLKLVVTLVGTPRAAAKMMIAGGEEVAVTHGFVPRKAGAKKSASCCPCDVIQGGHGALLEGAKTCADGVSLTEGMDHPCRLAMTYAGRLVGCVLVDLGPGHPELATRQILPLLVVTQQAALHLRQPGGSGPGPSQRAGHGEQANPNDLELRGLGTLRLKRDGESLNPEDFGRRSSLDILKILALTPGRSRAGEQLIEMLWPEIDEDSGKNRLHVALHSLRTILEPAGRRGKWRFVRTHQGQYLLEGGEGVWIDFVEFESLWRKVRCGRSARHSDSDWQGPLERMLALYQGDLFADSLYADWCEGQRTRLRRIFLEATNLHADVLIEAGQFDRAIERLQYGLLIEEFDDTLNRRLIEVLLAAGKRRLAQEVYEVYVRRLHHELDCKPQPETLRLGELLSLARRDFPTARRRLGVKV
ncbi:MAG: BTAD domain-containing putative transcriptional regulator [Bradymonadaceae bacterium]